MRGVYTPRGSVSSLQLKSEEILRFELPSFNIWGNFGSSTEAAIFFADV